jgi:hypothetical protein
MNLTTSATRIRSSCSSPLLDSQPRLGYLPVMSVLTPEMLADLLDLPMAALWVIVGIGASIALTGWRWHRFWLTLCISLVAGVIGLKQAAAWGINYPIVGGILLAAAAGCLSLSLARVGLFLAFGLACWYTMKRLAPPYAIPAICICAGGLFSVIFYRFCVILLTSSIGSLLLAYGGLAVAEQQKVFPTMTLLKDQSLVVHGCLAGLVAVTLMLQLYFWRQSKKKAKAEYSAEELEAERRLGFPVRGRAA